MKKQKLFELLTHVGGVKAWRWDTLCRVVTCIKNKKAAVLTSKWEDDFKCKHPDSYPLKLDELKTWSTYDKCFDLVFTNKNGDLICNAIIWDGDNLDGYRTKKRFTAEIKMPKIFIWNIEEIINSYFEDFLEEAYNDHLKVQKINWINDMRKQFLDLKP